MLQKIILASSSPRRKDLLESAGFEVKIFKPEVDETPRKGESPAALVRRLSQEKALTAFAAVSSKTSDPRPTLFVAADTIVVDPLGKRILGKPTSRADASKMLKSLSGKSHTVLTGFTVLYKTQSKKIAVHSALSKVVRTRVTIKPLTNVAIERYLNSGEPFDKAGSYAAQGIGMGFIEKIVGSYTNVVGLPMTEVIEAMEELTKLTLYPPEA